MPPFAALWQSLDIDQRMRIGLLNEADAQEEKNRLKSMKEALVTLLRDKDWLRQPENDLFAILKACLSLLAASQARIIIVNLEDLWLEIEPQNIPSTKTEYPNWQRRAR